MSMQCKIRELHESSSKRYVFFSVREKNQILDCADMETAEKCAEHSRRGAMR